MANFDKIKDVVLTYTDEYAKAIAADAPVRTGRLKNSYRGVTKLEDGKFAIEIYGEYYGAFQSYGVGNRTRKSLTVPEGINPPPTNGVSYQFKSSVRFIEPKRFIQGAIDSVTPRFAKDLEDAGVKDVEEFFDSLSKIKVS